MSLVGTVHRHGRLTGMMIDAATHTPGSMATYLNFVKSDDPNFTDQQIVEITLDEAAQLRDWLNDAIKET